jgi:pyridinium-3,5-biscarboxylic acid mononucleotide sulfurtransferase
MTIDDLQQKKERLRTILNRFTRLGVAFSGGVDSSLLLAIARQVMGDGVVALTAESPIHPASDGAFAQLIARQLGVRHIVFRSAEMEDPKFRANPPERCYWCKKGLLEIMRAQAAKAGIDTLVHGANLDDLADYRPGLKAAREAGVTAPLIEAGFCKSDIRAWAREVGLPNWDRPAGACLASRIPYGMSIESDSLARIEQAEIAIGRLGVPHCRVRHHGPLASIEAQRVEIERLAQEPLRSQVVDAMRALGYAHVCLDLEGYVSGKMNRDLQG